MLHERLIGAAAPNGKQDEVKKHKPTWSCNNGQSNSHLEHLSVMSETVSGLSRKESGHRRKAGERASPKVESVPGDCFFSRTVHGQRALARVFSERKRASGWNYRKPLVLHGLNWLRGSDLN
jgi:hypothetical protein